MYYILQIDYEELSKNKSEAWNEIKKQYRELIAFYHPDQFESKGQMKKEYAEKKTKELNLAFEQLETHYEKM